MQTCQLVLCHVIGALLAITPICKNALASGAHRVPLEKRSNHIRRLGAILQLAEHILATSMRKNVLLILEFRELLVGGPQPLYLQRMRRGVAKTLPQQVMQENTCANKFTAEEPDAYTDSHI